MSRWPPGAAAGAGDLRQLQPRPGRDPRTLDPGGKRHAGSAAGLPPGFGRTGDLFACRRASIQPDLIALSKGLIGGFLPMGVTMASERLYQGFISERPEATFFHGHSFTANPERFQQFEVRHTPLLEELARHPQLERCYKALESALESLLQA